MKTYRLSMVLLLGVCISSGCSGSKTSHDSGSSVATNPVELTTTEVSPPGATFELQQLPVDLTAEIWNWPSDASSWPAREFPPIHIFGRTYQGHVEPTLMFDMLKVGTNIVSPIHGVVVDVREQPESCDVELYIGSNEFQRVISLDHVTTTLHKGVEVSAGDVIATVPPWECKQDFGRFELMVMGEGENSTQAICPMLLLAPSVAEESFRQIQLVMEKWNVTAGSATSAYTAQDLKTGVCESETASAQ